MERSRGLWLVDDSEADHAMFVRAFQKNQIEVKSLYSAEEAVARIEAGERPPLVLLDIRMPGLGGFHFLEERNKSGLRFFPVVMVSSSNNPDDISVAYEHGANAYLQKPPDYPSLKKFVSVISEFWFELAQLPEPV